MMYILEWRAPPLPLPWAPLLSSEFEVCQQSRTAANCRSGELAGDAGGRLQQAHSHQHPAQHPQPAVPGAAALGLAAGRWPVGARAMQPGKIKAMQETAGQGEERPEFSYLFVYCSCPKEEPCMPWGRPASAASTHPLTEAEQAPPERMRLPSTEQPVPHKLCTCRASQQLKGLPNGGNQDGQDGAACAATSDVRGRGGGRRQEFLRSFEALSMRPVRSRWASGRAGSRGRQGSAVVTLEDPLERNKDT